MKKKKLDRQEIINQWLDLYPIRQMNHEVSDKNTAIIVVPHPENWFSRLFLPKPVRPAQRIQLDDVGTYIWDHFDGTCTLREICSGLKEKFGEKVSPAEERTVLFSQQMYQQKFIKVFAKKDSIAKQPTPLSNSSV